MKEILKRLLKLLLGIILIYSLVTLIIYLSNKDILGEEFGRILKAKDLDLIISASDKMNLNFKFIKIYEYIWMILSIIIPYIYIKLGLVEYVERKVRGSGIKRIFLRGSVYAITLFLLHNMVKLPKIIFSVYVRNYILYGQWNIVKVNILEELSKYNNFTCLIFFFLGVITFYYYKTSRYWYLIIFSMFIISNFLGGYLGLEIEKKEVQVYRTNNQFMEKEEALKKEFDIVDVKVKVIKNDVNSSAINAYVVGYFNNTRVYVLENAINSLNLSQYSALIAHEYAHCENNDILKSIVVVSIIDLMGLLIGIKIFKKIKKKRNRGNRDFFIAIFIINIVFSLLNPVKLAYSRYQELKADSRAMEVLGEGEGNLFLQYKIIENTSIPVDVDGLYKWLYYTHPTAVERIENAKNFMK